MIVDFFDKPAVMRRRNWNGNRLSRGQFKPRELEAFLIEFDFLFGSRRQEMQRLDRLFHSDCEGKHIIFMMQDEYARYKKRLYAIHEKGSEIKVHA